MRSRILAVAIVIPFLSALVFAQTAGIPAGSYAAKLGPEKWALRFAAPNKYTVVREGTAVAEGSFFINKNEITFRDENGPYAGKGAEQMGKYRWQLQDRRLTFTKIDDKLDGRFKALTFGPWVAEK